MSALDSHERPWRASGPLLAGLLVLRMAIGWHFFFEGMSKLLAAGWTSERYLSSAEGIFGGVFQAIASTPWMVGAVDVLNSWGLTLIGLGLMLGALTRVASLAGTALLLLYSLAHPALPGMTGSSLGGGSYLLVDRNIVEALTLVIIAMLPHGLLWGLDRLLVRRSENSAPGSEASVHSSGRRELVKDLAGVPVLGALAGVILGIRATSDETAAVDGVSGATTLLQTSSALGGSRGNIVSVRDFERLAPNHMTPGNFAYVAGGSGDGQTVRWNEAAFRELHLRLRVIHAQTEPDTRVQIFGRELPHPIMIAPARQADIHPEGELATVRGAGECGAVTIISTNATKSIEEVAAAASQPVWYQAYLYKDRERSRDNIQRAEAAGYQAICVTVDSSSNGPRDHEYRHRPMRNADRFQKHPGNIWSFPTSWDDFVWYRSLTKLPVIPKGILTAEDAVRSLELGADGVYISNHGGRNFDSGVATIQVLPAIVEAVAGRGPVIIDGGIRRGVDVLKALTLGATAIAVGRPFLYGLAVNGADGVAAVINMLWNELEMALISTGQQSTANLDKSALLPTPHNFFSS
jgi:4-hydroxymandelate oxidase